MNQRRLRLLAGALRAFAAVVPSDRGRLRLVRALAFRDKPRARRHLDHYLHGAGAPLTVPTEAVFREDPDFMTFVSSRIAAALRTGLRAGRIPVPQWIFADRDWRFALGGIELDWALADGAIEAGFRDRYCWKPDEPRPTRPLHRAAENLKAAGAREFSMIGSRCRIPLERVLDAVDFAWRCPRGPTLM